MTRQITLHPQKPVTLFLALATILLTGLFLPFSNAQEDADSPPIFNPGAPGKNSKTISAAQSHSLAQSRYTPDDVLFMQNMAIHHAQAVEMVSLIDGRSTHTELTALGSRITLSQSSEIAMMHRWLKRRGESISPPEGQGHMAHMASKNHGEKDHSKDAHQLSDQPLMTGMLSQVQMHDLAQANGQDFNYLFLTGMIIHHQGALMMVDNLLQKPGAGEDTVISEFTSSIVADQTAEILLMQTLLSELPN